MCGGEHYTNCEHIPKGYAGNDVFVYTVQTKRVWHIPRFNMGFKDVNGNIIDTPAHDEACTINIRLCKQCNSKFLSEDPMEF